MNSSDGSTNLESTIFLTNICYYFFSNGKLRKKLLWNNQKTTQTEKNSWNKIREKIR